MNNQNGSIILIALMVLSSLSLLAITSYYTSITEMNIFSNENAHMKALYGAEIAAIQAMRILHNTEESYLNEDLTSDQRTLKWLYKQGYEFDINNPENWKDPDTKSLSSTKRFMVVELQRVNAGESFTMTNKEQKKMYSIYARSRDSGGYAIVELGYLRWTRIE